MNANRLINMAFRMLMRFGLRWISQRANQPRSQGSDAQIDDNKAERRSYRAYQDPRQSAKKMRALRRFTKF